MTAIDAAHQGPNGGPRSRGRFRTLTGVLGGLLATVVLLVFLVAPLIIMLRLPPGGTPTLLRDELHLLLLGVIGIVVGIVLRLARTRPALAVTAAALVTLLALWFQRGNWWYVAAVPAPPLLPTVPPKLVLVAGALIGVVAVALAGRRGVASSSAAIASVVVGVIAAAVLVLVVETDVWGRTLFQQTFEGPWGISRMRWLALVFLGLVIAGALLGWVATSVAHGPIAPAVAAVIVLLTVLVVAFTAGLSGPPRTSLYGLALGILLVAIAASLRSPPPLVVRSDLAARSANTDA